MANSFLLIASAQATEAKLNLKQQKPEALSFERAIEMAQTNDPWLVSNSFKQKALLAQSIAASTMSDPKVSVSLANLPSNGFDLNQEAMTQFKVGIAQVFPRGDSLQLKQLQLKNQSEALPFLRQDRQAKVIVTVGTLWLDAFKVQQSILLIKESYSLFEQLADVAQASYSSTLGKTRQQDIVRAQLELTYLQDRLDTLTQKQDVLAAQMSPWLSNFFININAKVGEDLLVAPLVLTAEMPAIDLLKANESMRGDNVSMNKLARLLERHPTMLATEQRIKASNTGIALAKQKYQPQWGLNASYASRADDVMGNSRADLFSVGISFDLPLFTQNRQDMEVRTATMSAQATKTEQRLLLRKLITAYLSSKKRLDSTMSRQLTYQQTLLPQVKDQAEASLTAYTNDDGDFAEVVRSRIAVLNGHLEKLALDVEQQKLILELNYLLSGALAVRPIVTDRVGAYQ
jgi:outer membrane protein TolC